eukprot:900021-Pelagomonas_calceolata.AAC.2
MSSRFQGGGVGGACPEWDFSQFRVFRFVGSCIHCLFRQCSTRGKGLRMGCTGMESNQRQAGCWGEGWALFGSNGWFKEFAFLGACPMHIWIKRTVPEPLTIPHCIGPLAVSATLGAHLDSKG